MKMFKKAAAFITALMIVFAPVLNVSAFSDTENNWAKEYIDKLSGMGAIYGKEDGLFHPGDTILRSEFTAILLRSLGNDVGQPDSGKWYTLYMQEAQNKGYVKAGEFQNVEQNISRLEIARMITRVLGKEQLAAELHGKHTGFKDDYTVAMADKGYVIILKEYGVVNGTPEGHFLPDRSADRAEATKMIVTFLENKSRDINIKPDSYAQGRDGIYIKEFRSKQEEKVTSSHAEILPHINIALEIFAMVGGSTDIKYYKEDNCVEFLLFKNSIDMKSAQEDVANLNKAILGYYIYTEQELGLDYYLPFKIHLFNTQSTIGQSYIKSLIKEVFPQAYDTVVKELQNKVNDTNYENKVWKDIAGREIRIFTFKGHNQIDIYIAPEK